MAQKMIHYSKNIGLRTCNGWERNRAFPYDLLANYVNALDLPLPKVFGHGWLLMKDGKCLNLKEMLFTLKC